MRKLFCAIAIYSCSSLLNVVNAQVVHLLVEQLENEAKVPGKTYRVYANMTSADDQLLVVYGDSINPLVIKSSKPFYQHPLGGGMAKQSTRKEIGQVEQLKYDSWLTIGGTDNYDCLINALNLDLSPFEATGAAIEIAKDGAWFSLPTDQATKAGADMKILIGQFTTSGNLEGKISTMTRCANGESKQQYGLTFKSGK